MKCFFVLWNITGLDVFSNDGHMIVSVWSGVFMPKSDHMAQFVNDNPEFVAVFANRNSLRTITTPAHIGATPVEQNHTISFKSQQSFLFT